MHDHDRPSKVTHLNGHEHPEWDGVERRKRRLLDPETWVALIWRVAETWGFPALMCIAMGAFIWWQGKEHKTVASAAHVEFKSSMSDQTSAIKEMATQQRQTNERLIEIGASLNQHLQDGDRRRSR